MYRLAARGELVPELGGTNGVPGHGGLGQATAVAPAPTTGSTFSWSNLVDTIGKVVSVGGTIYDKYVDPSTQNAQLEIAKLQAQTDAERAKAALLQAQTAGRPVAATGGMFSGAGAGMLALAGAAVLGLVLFMKKR